MLFCLFWYINYLFLCMVSQSPNVLILEITKPFAGRDDEILGATGCGKFENIYIIETFRGHSTCTALRVHLLRNFEDEKGDLKCCFLNSEKLLCIEILWCKSS